MLVILGNSVALFKENMENIILYKSNQFDNQFNKMYNICLDRPTYF